MFTIADIFGYLLTFLIVWFIWTTYKAASQAAEKAKTTAIAKVTPVVSSIHTESARLKETSGEKVQEIAEPTFWESVYSSTGKFFSSLTSSPDEALHSINDSINNVITSVGSSSERFEDTDHDPENRRPRNRNRQKDALSSF
jgi:hypothetical protein